MPELNKYKTSLSKIGHYIYALCEIDGSVRKPFYIGKGQNNRCLDHLKETKDSEKLETIQRLFSENRLGIDILRHGIESDAVAKLIEATCIDLLGVGELANKVRGSGAAMGRISIEEMHNLQQGDCVTIQPEHSGLAFLLNSTYTSGMSDLALFEATRGIWHGVPRDNTIKFAYATYGGLIKEVYQIHSWVKAGTQQYFTRSFDRDISKRWEFVGCIAKKEVRSEYIGKVLKKERSYGTPFVRVGIPKK